MDEPRFGDGTGPRALGLDPGGSSAELILQRQLLSLVGVGPRIENEHPEKLFGDSNLLPKRLARH
ncbi:MAG: hypothetical protein VX656_13965 [Candidatus Latescibacterota bacterium]|nr:hypothetical protein [Candidatus Latescibacterota bacterium]